MFDTICVFAIYNLNNIFISMKSILNLYYHINVF